MQKPIRKTKNTEGPFSEGKTSDIDEGGQEAFCSTLGKTKLTNDNKAAALSLEYLCDDVVLSQCDQAKKDEALHNQSPQDKNSLEDEKKF